MAVFKDGADPHRELAPAIVALPKAVNDLAFRVLLAGLRALVLKLAEAIRAAAVRAGRAFRPEQALKGSKSRLFAMKPGVGKCAFGHDLVPSMWPLYAQNVGLSNIISPEMRRNI
jgi:hypothetical protein